MICNTAIAIVIANLIAIVTTIVIAIVNRSL